jgi:hypothetical protein
MSQEYEAKFLNIDILEMRKKLEKIGVATSSYPLCRISDLQSDDHV